MSKLYRKGIWVCVGMEQQGYIHFVGCHVGDFTTLVCVSSIQDLVWHEEGYLIFHMACPV